MPSLKRPTLFTAAALLVAACSDSTESPAGDVATFDPAFSDGAGSADSETAEAGEVATGDEAGVEAPEANADGMGGGGVTESGPADSNVEFDGGDENPDDPAAGGDPVVAEEPEPAAEEDPVAQEEPEPVVEEDPVAPEEPEPLSGDNLVALTFDDGPSVGQTNQILDKLEQHGAVASFFLVGANINEGTRSVLDRAAALGCDFENHSSGFGSLNAASFQQVQNAVNSTTQLIQQFTGTTPEFFRAPNLAVSDVMFQAIDLPFASGVLGFDFGGQNATPQSVTNNVLNNVQDGSIILLHDTQPGLNPHPTVEALDTIIPELRNRGLEIVTLRQLFVRRRVDPSAGPNGNPNAQWVTVPNSG